MEEDQSNQQVHLTPATLQRILRSSVTNRHAVEIGPFLLTIDPANKSSFRNYAVPRRDHASAADVQNLLAAFHERDLVPRLEIVSPAPGIEPVLAAAGFSTDQRISVLGVTGGTFRSIEPREHVAARLATTRDLLALAAGIQNQAYAGEPASDSDVDRLEHLVVAGGNVCLAEVDGEPAGSGLSSVPIEGFSEIAAVACLPQFRRHGAATAVANLLTRTLLQHNVTPFLQVEHEAERRLYERLGYAAFAELIFSTLGR